MVEAIVVRGALSTIRSCGGDDPGDRQVRHSARRGQVDSIHQYAEKSSSRSFSAPPLI